MFSGGTIQADGQSTKVHAEATLVLPLLIGKTFAKRLEEGSWAPAGRICNKSFTKSESDQEKRKVQPEGAPDVLSK